MRTTVVPAQVTTVEDRIMGNLGFSQLALIVIPVFVGAGIFIIFPPVMHGSLYKYVISAAFALLMGILAIRIKGKIILLWLVTILRYNLRPQFYLFNKNTENHRNNYRSTKQTAEDDTTEAVARQIVSMPKLAFQDSARVLEAIQNQNSNLRFEATKKGGLRVRFTEVKEQN